MLTLPAAAPRSLGDLAVPNGIGYVPVSRSRVEYPGAGRGFRVKDMPAQGSGLANYTLLTDFKFHQVVRIGVYPDRIYDPSYGGMIEKDDARDEELKWEDVNVISLFNGTAWFANVVGDAQQLEFTP